MPCAHRLHRAACVHIMDAQVGFWTENDYTIDSEALLDVNKLHYTLNSLLPND